MSIAITEPRYKSILFGSFAGINITNSPYQYLTDGRKLLDNRTKTLKYGFKLEYVARNFRNFEKCETYSLSQHGCDSFENCQEKCYLLGFAEKYGTIQFGPTPVYAQYFATNPNLKFNLSTEIDEEIKRRCSEIYPYKDCDKAFLTTHDKQIGDELMRQNNTLMINLLFEHSVITHILITNPWELTFHILTLGSVLFALSVPNLLLFLYELTKLRFLKLLISPKVLLTISVVGFCLHSFFILRDSLYSDLLPEFMTNFSFLEPNKNLPVLVFCIGHGVAIEAQHSLTGYQLQSMTKEIDLKYVFKEIRYRDENYDERYWSPGEPLPENLRMETFFVNSYKCFEVHYRLNPYNIYSSYVYNIIRVILNSEIGTYVFSYRTHDSLNLIDYYEFRANVSHYCNFDYMQEEFTDRFQWIKSPTLLYRQLIGDDRIKKTDISDYIDQLKADLLAKDKVVTTLMPLYPKDFGDSDGHAYEINNDKFKNMIRYTTEIKELFSVTDENYKRNYFNLLLSFAYHENTSMVAMKKVFLEGNLVMAK